jgi:molybdate transport system substrate-binding protein
MIKAFIIPTILCLVLTSCNLLNPGTSGTREESDSQDANISLTIFTAASLVEPFDEIADLFESQNPGVDLILNFAGSQQLAHQIAQGAPCDVFASADTRQMDAIVQTGRINPQSPLTFTHNQLVVIFPAANPADIQTLQDLSKPGLKLVLAAAAVPVGNYSLQFLTKASGVPGFSRSFKQEVLNNVVSYESNVKAVLSKVLLGEADAGIVYTSDITDSNTNQLGTLPIPEDLNILADYLIAALTDSHHPQLANDYIAFIISPIGQEILSKHGFIMVK